MGTRWLLVNLKYRQLLLVAISASMLLILDSRYRSFSTPFTYASFHTAFAKLIFTLLQYQTRIQNLLYTCYVFGFIVCVLPLFRIQQYPCNTLVRYLV